MAGGEKNMAAARREMVQTQLRARGINNEDVLKAFSEIPRERFIPTSHRREAYGDHPVPIGHGQTISQPYVVALMVQELDPRPGQRVLDVGAGSGYQTAILSRLVAQVYAIERLEALARDAKSVLAELNIDNVTFSVGDGSLGLPEEAPFDHIICGAAAPDVPPSWVEQLAEAGRIVMPVGCTEWQYLIAVEKHGKRIRRREICGVRFVKLIGKEGWRNDGD